jgi:hypothetical protein
LGPADQFRTRISLSASWLFSLVGAIPTRLAVLAPYN